MVYAIAKENNNVVSYLVTSDYFYDQKHWVSKDDISFVSSAYGQESVTTPQNYYSWVTTLRSASPPTTMT